MVQSTKKGGRQATRQKKKKVADKVKGTGSKEAVSKVTMVSAKKGGKTRENKRKEKLPQAIMKLVFKNVQSKRGRV